ncbi:DUF6044 family protein [Sulfurimonas sp. HSL1-2]|uniref:DUF6044 family protein n=1 Tax=Thiomicrolovo zhangzhouensis TaxID=3131933 RepID=UPI0031F8881F
MKRLAQTVLDKRTLLVAALTVLGLYLLPLWVTGDRLYILVFDNLDSPILLFKVLAESHQLFAPSMEIIPNMMSGLPRLSFGSEYNVQVWLYLLFSPFLAYQINLTLVHLVGFIGMYLLMNRLTPRDTGPYRQAVAVLSALLFSILPFWPPGGLSVSGLPLLLYLFLKVRDGEYAYYDIALLLLFPLYSSFVLSGVFFLTAITLLWIADVVRKKALNAPFVGMIALLGLSYLLVNYRLVDQMLLPSDFISHRSEFFRDFGSFFDSYRFAHLLFLNGQEHTSCSQANWIIPTILIGLSFSVLSTPLSRYASLFWLMVIALSFLFPFWQTMTTQRYSLPMLLLYGLGILLVSKKRLLPLLWIIQIAISYWHGFWTYEGWIGWVEKYQILRSFDFSRFYFLQPMLWIMMLGIAFAVIVKTVRYGIVMVLAIAVLQSHALFQSKTFMKASGPDRLSFHSYYAETLFQRVRTTLDEDPAGYRVVAFGIPPAVLIWNGFYTIDGYVTNYPLSYKHEFAKLLEKDFAKRPQNKAIFEHWGSKCYLTGGVSYTHYVRGQPLDDVQLDTARLRAMNVRYLFSAHEIRAPERDALRLKTKVVNDQDSYWDVYVYELDTAEN